VSLVRIKEATFSYAAQPEVVALKDVSYDIERGSFVGITGPSDAGKSTLCRLIAGYVPHLFDGELSGTVVVDGIPTTETSVGELAGKVGFVFENPFDQLTGASLTVLEEVAFALENMGLPREEIELRARESLERVGIAHLADRHPQRLSGGQSQRVALASVLALQPEIFVLDEPTSQLDPLGAGEVFEVVADLHRDGYTIVVVSQDLDRLATHADRLLVLEGGHLRWDGPPQGVLASAVDSDHPLLIPKVVEVGHWLRKRGLIDGRRPLPVTVGEAAAELTEAETILPRGRTCNAPTKGSSVSSRVQDPQVVLEDVRFAYDKVHALDGLSLELNEGCVCVVGQNGAGKTTLIKHLNGLLRPTGGRVLVRGKDTREHRVAELARDVALAFQNPDDQLFRGTVEEEVRFGATNVGFPPDKVQKLTDRAVELLDLGAVREKKPYDLGLSWRKRVAIASVLTMNSPVVVLDEPTGGQDARGIELLGGLIEHLVGEGKLVVVVTHDVEFAARHADRVVALYKGNVLMDGDPGTVFRREQELAKTYVQPPAIARLGRRLGLSGTVLSIDELLGLRNQEHRDAGPP
jgi:energy-coupling factor transport system ATP-binding protein